MSSVLSQSEVDALLKGISGGEFEVEQQEGGGGGDEEIIPYDLTSQDRIIRGRMPTLEIIHDRFVRLFRLTLSTALRKVVDISVRSTELIKFGEFLKTLPVPSSLNLFRMSPLRGNAIMVLETRLVFTLIDLFFGGTGELEVKAEGRDFSAIEQRMIKRVVISALEDLQQSWRPVFPVQITFIRSEVNPQFVAIVPHSEVVVVVTFDVEMGRAPMSITLCIPYSMIEPVKEKLYSGIQGDKFDQDQRWVGRLKDILMGSPVEVTAEIGKTTVTFSDLMSFKEGDVLTLNTSTTDELVVKVEEVPKFRGLPGYSRGNQSIKITKIVT